MMKQNPLSLIVLISCALIIGCDKEEDQLDITGITFTSTSIEVTEGTSVNLEDYYEVSGTDADQAQLTFSSDDTDIVSVDGTTLTAAGIGSTKVTATESNSGLTASADVTVVAKLVAVTGITLDKDEANLKVGDTFQLTATITPEDATEKGIIWSVNFPPESKNTEDIPTDIATVSETGLVTAVAAGDIVITAKSTDGEFTASASISITKVNVTGVTLSPDPISMAGITTLQLTAEVAPENATNKTVFWSLTIDQNQGDAQRSLETNALISADYYAEIDIETGIITSKNTCDNCGLMAKVTTNDGEFSDELPVEITYVAVTSIILDPSQVTIDVGATQQMTPTVLPENASNPKVNWSLEFSGGLCDANPSDLASVSETGLVTGLAQDACGLVVKATSQAEQTATATAGLTINPILATSVAIYIDGETITDKMFDLLDGASITLLVDLAPTNTTNTDLTWIVTNPDGSTPMYPSIEVDGGVITTTGYGYDVNRVTVTNEASGETDYIDIDVLVP